MLNEGMIYRLAQVERYWRDTQPGRDGQEWTALGTPHLIMVLAPSELPQVYPQPPAGAQIPTGWRKMMGEAKAGERAVLAQFGGGEAVGVVRQSHDGDAWHATGVVVVVGKRVVVIDPLYECLVACAGWTMHRNLVTSQSWPQSNEALVLMAPDGKRRGLLMPALHGELDAGAPLRELVDFLAAGVR